MVIAKVSGDMTVQRLSSQRVTGAIALVKITAAAVWMTSPGARGASNAVEPITPE